jgi:hypothetical protein
MLNKYTILQTSHPLQFTKLAMDQPEAPGAKTPQNCPWWARFRPDQGQKPHKTAPGQHFQKM